MLNLEGKTVVVTAAAAGIGRETAIAAAEQGARVIATDIDTAGLASIASDRIVTRELDVIDRQAIASLFSELGKVDGLVNVAGIVHHGTIEECTMDEWQSAFQLNVDSMFHTIRGTLPDMLANGGGSIVNIASAASSVKGFHQRFVYGTTKAAVIGLTKSVAIDYVDKQIRCNAICPGTVDTPSLRERVRVLGEDLGGYHVAMQRFISRQPMGRLGKAREVAALAVFLLSDEAAFITGQTHIIDGGILA